MRELVFLSCDMNAAPTAGDWARAALRNAGMPARLAQQAARRLSDAFSSAVTAIQGADADGAQDAAQVMLVLSDEDGELAFEMIADCDRSEKAFQRAHCAPGCRWEAVERRVAGDGVTCLRMRATR